MKPIDFTSPRAAARPFTPKLADFVEQPLYSGVWADPALAPRDRSLITIACLIALNHANELPAHLRRGIENGLTESELSEVITHLAFYAGFPAAITASACANATFAETR
ncbi:carboxymuconolactone decarboxylase family protein [Erwinia sp. E602]|uniref:carboxymuconolactone decarboxylase family protein n=1 Tax=unclassified Erwinia TaxID=2622719 RepID=UPI0006FE15DB|nr:MULTISPECIES: carboxymuconolactone decarboxylase family protein [unclassified Erwinia]KQN64760.1 4-carboxymuconolactone decarboxylase [Erwinia sp. Leaf53]PLV62823.1 4-carboxymuconolactone decarboxylase [Erwinia sp. B116]QUG74599.1 carboxymuconolactone decarboxylase family protein [Erwinia sp. E602]